MTAAADSARIDASNGHAWLPSAPGMRARTVRANEIDFDLVEAGPEDGERLAIMLHGFPELNFSWRHQIEMLAGRGWRVWAPNQRGYGGTTKPKSVAAYHVEHLTADIAALIDTAKAEHPASEVMLVAHDWGGAVAWEFLRRALRPVDRLIMMNMPHPARFFATLRQSTAQKRKSWYIAAFQIPWLPEWGLTRNDAAAVRRAFSEWTTAPDQFPDQVLDVYARAAQRPGAATAMVNWYRAAFRDGRRMRAEAGEAIIDVPTLLIYGEQDQALGLECFEGTDAFVRNLTFVRIPDASHWVQQDRPARVNEIMAEWLDG